MKITFVNSEYDYRNKLEIELDGESVFCVCDGEPEDNTLNRNFNDCYTLSSLLKRVYEAGKNGEPFEIESVEREWE